MDRLTILCFAGTYSLALASDLARFLTRSRLRWYPTVALTALGWAVHTAFLGNLARSRHELLPVTTVYESLLVLAWVLAAIDLYLLARSPGPTAVGVFILPLVVALATAAGLSGQRADWVAWGGPVWFWGTVHGVLLLLGAVSTCVATVAGLMYLVQARRLKHKRPARFGFALPSLEQSERLNRGAIALAFPLLTSGLLIGMALIPATRGAGGHALGWTDPKVLSTGALWLVFAALLHARYRPAMRGRRVAVLTMVAFVFLAFAWVGVGPLLPSDHGAARAGGGPR